MTNLMEAYSKRLSIAEAYFTNKTGRQMDNQRKMCVAKLLDNTAKFLNEAMFQTDVSTGAANAGTGATDLGLYKKFSLNLTNVAIPTLIAHDLVAVQPMSAMSGYFNYLQYTVDGNKVENNDVNYNSPFALGKVNSDYTANSVVEPYTAGMEKLSFAPVVVSSVKFKTAAGADVAEPGLTVDQDGNITGTAAEGVAKVAYTYNNIYVPQTKLPVINATMTSIALIAKARRIAVYYSQIAAFQAKQDYGFDLNDALAEQAVGRLNYEIDIEVVEGLKARAIAKEDGTVKEAINWDRTLPVGVSKAEHFEGFAEAVGYASQLIYTRTKRFAANWMIISADILPILPFIKGWVPTAFDANGPYMAGTLNGVKVFVSPSFTNEFVVGVKGSDNLSVAGIYAPYMAVVPTQLLQYADGGTSQGWSTLYDFKVVNDLLLVYGTVTGTAFGASFGTEDNPVRTTAVTE